MPDEQGSESQDTGHDERRRHPRQVVDDLSGILQSTHPVRIVDLSATGAAVEASERLLPNHTYRLRMDSREGEILTSGRVVWAKLTGTREIESGDVEPVFRAGIRFESELGERGRRLLQQLEERSPKGIGTRLQARFKMGELASTLLLSSESTFDVRVLSLGGMAAEMSFAPRLGSVLDLVLPLGDVQVEIRGTVANVTPVEGAEEHHLVGIQFRRVDPEVKAALEAFLERMDETEPS